MAISLGDNLAIKNKKQNVERDGFATIADMKAFSENYLPDVFHAVCYEDGKMYLFNRSNTVDATTGKWRELSGGGSTPEPAPTPVKNKYYYYGTSATNTGIDLSALTKEVLSLADTDIEFTCTSKYVVIAVPTSGGSISIFDENGLNNTGSFVKTVISDGTEDYDVYVSDSQISCTNFKYTIKY